MTTEDKKEKIVDMSFREMLTGLFNTEFLLPDELDTICKAGEMYAEAKLINYLKRQQQEIQKTLFDDDLA